MREGIRPKDLLSVTLRTILGGVIVGRVCVHGFTAPRQATGRRYRGLDLARNRGLDDIVVGSADRPLGVLWNGEARPGPCVCVLVDVRLLLGLVCAWVAWCQGGGHGGLWRNVGRGNWSDVVYVKVHVGGRLLLLLRVVVAVLLEGRSDCRNDGLNL